MSVAESIRAIIAEDNQQFLERAAAIEAVWLCLLAGQHGYLMGPSGTAKSALLNATTAHITGARYWHIQMDRTLDKSESFGQYDIARFEAEQVWERDYTDTFGDCHIALLDEIDKAGPASLVPYLEMLEKRRFKPGKQWVQAPLISAFGAANTALSQQDGALAAIADRFLLKVPVRYVASEGSFVSLLQSAVTAAPRVTTTITLEQLQQVRTTEIPAVTLPLHIATTLHRLRRHLMAADIVVSDRRWKASVWLLQAHAWLRDRQVITEDDLSILRFVLWVSEDDIATVAAAIRAVLSEHAQAVLAAGEQMDDILAEVMLRRDAPKAERKAFAGTATLKVNSVGAHLELLAAEAEATGRDLSPILRVQEQVTEARLLLYRDFMQAVPTRKTTRKGTAA